MKHKILSLLTLLVVCVTGAWATDYIDTYTTYNGNAVKEISSVKYLSCGLYTMITFDNTNIARNSSGTQITKKTAGTFTIYSRIPGLTIKSIEMTTNNDPATGENMYSATNGTLAYDSENKKYTFTPSGTPTSTQISITAGSSATCLNPIRITLTGADLDYEELTAFTSTLGFTSTAATSELTLTTTNSNRAKGNNTTLSFQNNGDITFTASNKKIKYITFCYDQYMATGFTDNVVGSSYSVPNILWTAPDGGVSSVQLNQSNSSTATVSKILVIFEPSTPAKAYSVSAVTSTGTDDYGTVSAAASSLDQDETTTITATPATGYQVTNWAVSGEAASISPNGASNSSTTTLTMGTANATVTVTFGAINYAITHSEAENGSYTIKVANGTPTGESTTANYGQTITLAATPDDGYELNAWNVTSGGNAVTVTSNQFTMPAADVTIAPTFSQLQATTPTISPTNGSTFSGSSQTITITADGADHIYYTLDGTDPTVERVEYDSENKPSISSTTTVKAFAVKDGYADSEMASATITKVVSSVVGSWNFTNWSSATKAGMIADTETWNQYEKTGSAGINFGENGRSNISSITAGSTLKYGSTNIAETEGLTFVAGAYGLGLIFNMASATVSSTEYTYHGSQYLWLYNSNAKITIPSVPANAVIEIGVESHNGGSERGVTLKNGESTLTQTQGTAKSTTYQECKWSNTTAGDVTVTPTAGLHIYYITVTVDVATVPVSTKAERNYGSYVTSEKLDFGSAEGITAYIATGLNGTGNAVVLQSVDVVPASTPIIVKTASQGATVNVPVTTADADDAIEDNLLVAGDGTTSYDAGTYYFLKQDQFYLATSGTLQTGKAYLQLTGSLAPSVIRIVEGENTATSINDIESSDEAVKFIQNGQLYIKRNGVVYDAMGRIIR